MRLVAEAILAWVIGPWTSIVAIRAPAISRANWSIGALSLGPCGMDG